MTKIAILNAGHMEYGGTERVVAFQARGLYEKGYDVSIFTPVNNKEIFSDIIPKEVPIKAWWYTLPIPLLKRTVNRLLHFWFGGQLKEFDIVIAHNQPAPYVAYKNKKKNDKPYIVYCHAPWRRLYPREIDLKSGWASDYREKIMFLYRNYWYRIDRESIQGADALLANSKRIKEEVNRVYGVSATVCYPGIDLAKYRSCSEEEVDKVIAKYGINEFSLLVVGRHSPQKKLEWVPTILHNLVNRFPKVQAIVTGMSNRLITPQVISEAVRLHVKDRLKLVGPVTENELIALYHTCPVIAYCAVYEDFGLPPVEAMACGCVPVAWNEGAGPCETIVDGETGLLAKPYDLNDFSEKIAFLIDNDNKRQVLARNGVKNSEQYSWEVHQNILEKALHEAIG